MGGGHGEGGGLGWGVVTVRSGGLAGGMLVGIGIWQNGIFYALDFFRF